MSAWKSSDGGSIRVLGESQATIVQGPGGADTQIISAAENTEGVFIRTCVVYAVTPGYGYIQAGGKIILIARSETGAYFANLHSEIFIPPATAVLAGGISCVVDTSFDLRA
tara:strand:+ start:380 stop:712 length:333 start_codon:yes stop_codon:yes gene_type:complete